MTEHRSHRDPIANFFTTDSALFVLGNKCLLAIAKELPLTLLLTPLGQHTLAYRLFDAQQEGSTPDVGLAGLCLLAIAALMFTLVHLKPRRSAGHV